LSSSGSSSQEYADYQVMLVRDVRRAVDYLASRPDLQGGGRRAGRAPRAEMIRESLAWLDNYLGPVQSAATEARELPVSGRR
jgi:hypothetical protein